MGRLEGRSTVVTGAASGIGRALAARVAAEGMSVVPRKAIERVAFAFELVMSVASS